MSLLSSHPIWTTAGASPYQTAMSTVQATMLSGRYRTELLCSNWSTSSSHCKTPSCHGQGVDEDLHHILAACNSLETTRQSLAAFTSNVCLESPQVKPIVQKFCAPTHPQFVQFLLDCSALPEVILMKQQHGPSVLNPLFRITRTWCYCLHRARLKILDRWIKF